MHARKSPENLVAALVICGCGQPDNHIQMCLVRADLLRAVAFIDERIQSLMQTKRMLAEEFGLTAEEGLKAAAD